MDLACSFCSTLLTLIVCTLMMNLRPTKYALLAMTITFTVSCSRKGFVEQESSVTRIYTVGRHLTAVTLPGFSTPALLID
jgi:hypothetical protein